MDSKWVWKEKKGIHPHPIIFLASLWYIINEIFSWQGKSLLSMEHNLRTLFVTLMFYQAYQWSGGSVQN